MIDRKRLFPFIFTAGIVMVDQLTKVFVVRYIPFRTIGASFFGDFFRIVHERNDGAAFSIGQGLPDAVRFIVFSIIPLIVLAWLIRYIYISRDLSRRECWSLAGIAGGGIGNIVDRLFRPEGVVDFFDVKFYGILGMKRWPTFNIADASIVVCGILFIIFSFVSRKEKTNE